MIVRQLQKKKKKKKKKKKSGKESLRVLIIDAKNKIMGPSGPPPYALKCTCKKALMYSCLVLKEVVPYSFIIPLHVNITHSIPFYYFRK